MGKGKKQKKVQEIVKEPSEEEGSDSVPSQLASDDSEEEGKLGYDDSEGQESDMDLDDELAAGDDEEEGELSDGED